MITISEEVYQKLMLVNEHESCGFLGGADDHFNYIYLAKNKDKKLNRFKIGALDKIIFLIKMLKNNCDQYILFHVHEHSLAMSELDVKNSKVNSYNIIKVYGTAKLYKTVANKEGEKFPVEITYRVA